MDMELSQRSLGAADAEIDRFIERRAQQREAEPDELEPGYIESVRIYQERSEAEMRGRWIEFHRNMQQLHSALADEHAQKAEALCEGNGELAADNRARAARLLEGQNGHRKESA